MLECMHNREILQAVTLVIVLAAAAAGVLLLECKKRSGKWLRNGILASAALFVALGVSWHLSAGLHREEARITGTVTEWNGKGPFFDRMSVISVEDADGKTWIADDVPYAWGQTMYHSKGELDFILHRKDGGVVWELCSGKGEAP